MTLHLIFLHKFDIKSLKINTMRDKKTEPFQIYFVDLNFCLTIDENKLWLIAPLGSGPPHVGKAFWGFLRFVFFRYDFFRTL